MENESFEFIKNAIIEIKRDRPSSERKKANKSRDTFELLSIMSEGDALSYLVLGTILSGKNFGGIRTVLRIDDMNMRGSQISAGFAYCDYNMQLFCKKVKEKDTKMILAVNINSAKRGETEFAVRKGTVTKTLTPKFDNETYEFLKEQDDLSINKPLSLRVK